MFLREPRLPKNNRKTTAYLYTLDKIIMRFTATWVLLLLAATASVQGVASKWALRPLLCAAIPSLPPGRTTVHVSINNFAT